MSMLVQSDWLPQPVSQTVVPMPGSRTQVWGQAHWLLSVQG
jgi:hypothetical protein